MPFDQINADNFDELVTAWRWYSIDSLVSAERPELIAGEFKPTPLVVDGVMYLPTSFCQFVALDPGTGELLWSFDPKSYEAGRPTGFGFQHRGLSYWTDGEAARLFLATHDRRLWSVDAKTGEPCKDFGTDGFVELESTLGRKSIHEPLRTTPRWEFAATRWW
jgi:quinoprotein glucose dehydrogenase